MRAEDWLEKTGRAPARPEKKKKKGPKCWGPLEEERRRPVCGLPPDNESC